MEEGAKILCSDLKHCWIAHENGEYKYQRYYIDDIESLYNFIDHEKFEHCKKLKHILIYKWLELLNEGNVLIVSDNTISGYPSYTTSNGIKIIKIVCP